MTLLSLHTFNHIIFLIFGDFFRFFGIVLSVFCEYLMLYFVCCCCFCIYEITLPKCIFFVTVTCDMSRICHTCQNNILSFLGNLCLSYHLSYHIYVISIQLIAYLSLHKREHIYQSTYLSIYLILSTTCLHLKSARNVSFIYLRTCYSRPRSLCFHSKSLTQVLSWLSRVRVNDKH